MTTLIHETQPGRVKAKKALPLTMGCAITVSTEANQVEIPAGVTALDTFRAWVDQDDFPKEGRIWYWKGRVWIDMSKEELFNHLEAKAEYTMVLRQLVKAGRLGFFIPDGLRLTNVVADLSCGPDGTFVAYETLRQGLAKLVKGQAGTYVELEGTPDMVLEIVSPSSVDKDLVVLRKAYWEAGIREYWLVDARHDPVEFDILRHAAKGYLATRKQGGWLKSTVLGKSFRLTRETNADGYPELTLAVR